MRGDRVDFLVQIVLELRVFDVGGEQRHHVGAETFRNYDRRIVFAGFHPVDCLVAFHELPVQLVVGVQCADDGFAHVDAHRYEIRLVTLVVIGHGDLQCLGVAVGVPAGRDVEPGVQRRHHHQAHRDDHGDHVAGGMAHVPLEDAPDHFHCSFPSSRRLLPAFPSVFPAAYSAVCSGACPSEPPCAASYSLVRTACIGL